MNSAHESILNVDYLVFSSHKSGTQTVLNTLNGCSRRCLHLHTLENIGLRINRGDLFECLNHYSTARKQRLTILSTFRDPLDRHISSFFQWHGIGVLCNGLIEHPEDTIVARMSLEELTELFLSQLRSKKFVGYRDSLHQICSEMNQPVSAISFSPKLGFGSQETELMRLVTFRFDQLFATYPRLLEEALAIPLIPVLANLSDNHWYHEKYKDFKKCVKLPNSLIEQIYEDKRDLVNIFYPGLHDSLIVAAQAKYGY